MRIKMAKKFNVEIETSTREGFNFRGAQEANFDREKCERVFQWRDIRGNVGRLPNYVWDAIKEAGFKPVYLGGTRFNYSVIGLVKNA
jgi:hypothetical protein